MSATDIATSVDVDLDLIYEQTKAIAEELINTAAMKPGQILVVGCSSSEIAAHAIGCYSSSEVGQAVFTALSHVTKKHGLYLAAQCCEHLNRALIVEEECAAKYGLEMVNVKPQLKAGGSFSTAAWNGFEHPCAVEFIKAHAGIDIGDTLIGMHLRHVAVPVRTTIKSIGSAMWCAREHGSNISAASGLLIRNKKGAVALTCGSSFYISNTKRRASKSPAFVV